MKHADARKIVTIALGKLLGSELTKSAIQICSAIGYLESGYGRNWRGEMKDSKNWGAVQAGKSWQGATAVTRDSYVGSNGKTVFYETKFRAYETDEDAAYDFCRIILKYVDVQALIKGDVLAVSRSLRAHRSAKNGGQDLEDCLGYYEGHGATPDIRERNHAAAVFSAVIRANLEIGERENMPDGSRTPQTLKPSYANSIYWVDKLRGKLGLQIGGSFPISELGEFQEKNGLKVDYICGPSTWGKILAFF